MAIRWGFWLICLATFTGMLLPYLFTKTASVSIPVPDGEISHRASSTLRGKGYTIFATMLHIYPQMFLHSSLSHTEGKSTLFALPDSVISNCSLPYWAWKFIFQYHALPSERLSFETLLVKSTNTCLATGVPTKKLALTEINAQKGSIEINNVRILYPDLFVGGGVTIHGISGSFTNLRCHEENDYSLDFTETQQGCSPPKSADTLAQWKEIISVLGMCGYHSFAEDMNSVLHELVLQYPRLTSGTIFAPKVFGSERYPGWLVKSQILLGRYKFSDLVLLPDQTSLTTLVRGKDVKITRSALNSGTSLSIGGAVITHPEACSTNIFVVHGISQPFQVDDGAAFTPFSKEYSF